VALGFLHPGHYSACFAESKQDLVMHDVMTSRRLRVQFPKEAGSGGIVAGRNEVARAFLASDCEWLFVVDSDMGFAPDTVDRLIASAEAHDVPVMGALCFAQKADGPADLHARRYRIAPTLYDFHETDDAVGFIARTEYARDAVQPVSATGSACLVIHRDAMQAVRAQYGERWYTPVEHPKGPTTFSEDLSFCVRVAACGLGVAVDTAVKTTHDKHGIYLDESTFDVQEAARRVT
jgi:molybdopterin-guanine dinucleotide biosynthesis protein A